MMRENCNSCRSRIVIRLALGTSHSCQNVRHFRYWDRIVVAQTTFIIAARSFIARIISIIIYFSLSLGKVIFAESF